ncbi:MAG: flavin reductase [Firmicutes bacterium]|nr:flavin reductase [Bacillota bacterium]
MRALEQLSYGTFVLTIQKGDVRNGCILNTVIQINEDTLLMSMANFSYSRSLLDVDDLVTIHTIHNQASRKIFEQFGYQSGRNADKFEGVSYHLEGEHILLEEGVNNYFKGKIVQKNVLDTHTVFIVHILDSQVLNDIPSLTYKEYQEILKPKKKTMRNLEQAFSEEAKAYSKYSFYASIAKKEGYPNIAKLFLTIADNEREHAKIWYKELGNLKGNTEDVLKAAILSENKESNETYKRFEKEAREEGDNLRADYFQMIQSIEKNHASQFYKVLDELEKDKLFKEDKEVNWACANCGYVYTGKEALMMCPLCKHPQGYMERRDSNENL